MPRRATNSKLQVFLNSRLVGYLNRQTSGAVSFKYDQSWLDWGNALPVSLSLPLREARFTGQPVIAVFENLLPDNEQIRRTLAERTGAEGVDAYSLLSAVGRDCVGALQFLPDGQDAGSAGLCKGRLIGDEGIADKIRGLGQNPLGLSSEEDFRISIAGAQEKTALLYHGDQWQVPKGTTATTHILKPPIGKLPNGINLSDSVENEYFCMQLCSALGLPVAKTEIGHFTGQKTLIVERFDRLWAKDGRLLRLPQEDCCQALSVPPIRKYESEGGPGMEEVLSLLRASDNPEQDRELFIKAQIIFGLMGATDGHAKNFSIHLLPGGRFHLTPLYDIMSAQPYVDRGELTQNKMKLAMSVGDNRHYPVKKITVRHFKQTARASGLNPKIIDEIIEGLTEVTPKAVERTLSGLPNNFPMGLAESIIDGFKRRLDGALV